RVYPERAHLLGCETGWKMREEIARVVPFYDGVQRLKNTGDAIQYGGPHLCAGWKFPTPDGKAHFRAVPLPKHSEIDSRRRPTPDSSQEGKERPDARRQFPSREGLGVGSPATFIVSTQRGKQFNSLVYAEIDPLNGAPRDAMLMNP